MRSIQSFMVFTIILVVILSHSKIRVLQAQTEASAALLKWKASLNKQSQSDLVSWDINNSCHGWTGIKCSNSSLSEFVVTGMSLSGFNIKGSLDSLNFSSFPNLEVLSLDSNSLFGSIPSSLAKVSKLRILNLSYNNFSGVIPSEIGMLPLLEKLYLFFNRLTGHIPNSIANLTNLIELSLYHNELTGPIPQEIGMVSAKLEGLNFGTNNLTGEIPSSLGNLTHLHFLYLLNNHHSGSIPDSFRNLTWLDSLDLSSNNLSGPFLFNLKSLRYLNLDDNMLNGTLPVIPLSIIAFSVQNNKIAGEVPSQICSSEVLEVLHLSNNKIGGVLPDCFKNNSRLSSLNLNWNQLQGRVPRSLMNCRFLEVLNLGNNMINDTFPHWLADLQYLQVLVLSSNKLQGRIEGSSSNLLFPKLRILDLSRNLFTGRLPSEYFKNFKAMTNIEDQDGWPDYIGFSKDGSNKCEDSMVLVVKGSELKFEKILTILTTIDLSDNKFEGGIPSNIRMLNSLRYLNLSHNYLTGRIPAMLDNLTKLESLDLSSNQIQGEISAELTRLSSLSFFNVSGNRLSGTIPRGPQFNTFRNSSYQGNPELCGFPLSNNYGDEEPTQLQKQNDDDTSGFFDGFTWESVVLGYGCGIVLGVGLGCLMFSIGKPIWVMKIVSTQKRRKRRSQIR